MTGPTADAEVEEEQGPAEPAESSRSAEKEGEPGSGSGDPRAVLRRLSGLDRRLAALIALVVVAAVAGGAWWQLSRDSLPDGAAFRVGGRVVSAADVQKRIDSLKALYGVTVPTSGSKKTSFERDAAKSLAVQIILQDKAEQMGVTVKPSAVDATLNRLISERYADGGRTAFVAALGQLGASEAQVRDEIGNQILVSELFDAVTKGITVSDADVRTAFLDRRAQLATPPERDLRNIVVADRATAARVLRQLAGGASFATLAAQVSLDGSTRDKGGELGPVAASQLDAAYAKAAFSARVGGVFGPIRNRYGWNVGMVERAIPGRPAVLAKVATSLRRTLKVEKQVAAWRDWLGKAITEADVTYADAYRPADPDAVPDTGQTGTAGSTTP